MCRCMRWGTRHSHRFVPLLFTPHGNHMALLMGMRPKGSKPRQSKALMYVPNDSPIGSVGATNLSAFGVKTQSPAGILDQSRPVTSLEKLSCPLFFVFFYLNESHIAILTEGHRHLRQKHVLFQLRGTDKVCFRDILKVSTSKKNQLHITISLIYLIWVNMMGRKDCSPREA